jgi:hypothetical protein
MKELENKIANLIKDFKLELNTRDKKIAELANEVKHLHLRLSIHWESNPKEVVRMINNAKKKELKVKKVGGV